MALYVVIAPGKGDMVQGTVASVFPDNYYRIGQEAWVISARGLTTQQVSNKLDISRPDDFPGQNANAVVFALQGSYWGRYSVSLWEWLKVKLEVPNA